MKKVFQYSKSGEFLEEFPSARSLDNKYELSPDSFRKHIDTNRLYQDHYWSYIKADSYKDIQSGNIAHEDVEESIKYTVNNGNYMWRSKRGTITLSIEEADHMFQDYSRKGNDLTQSQMIRKYHLSPQAWNSIKNTLMLYKESNIFSPYTEEQTPPKQLEQMMEEKFSDLHQNRDVVLEKAYRKATYKQYRKAIDDAHKHKLASEGMLIELSDLLPHIEPVKVRETQYPSAIYEANVFIADLHTGAGVQNLQITPNFSIDILEKKLIQLANKVNELNAEKVNLFFLGDNIESFSGLNHTDSWKSIEEGYYGAKVVYHSLHLMLKFVSRINNVKYIGAIGGNHDRMSSSKKEDAKGEIAKLTFMLMKDTLKDKITVDYNDYVTTKNSGTVRYIIAHGDHNNIKKPEKMVLDYGNPFMFNLVLAGHLHTREIKNDSHNMRFVRCPSIFTGNDYSERNGWTSSSGAIIAYGTGLRAPRIIDEPL